MSVTPPLSDCLAQAQARGNDPAQCGFELSRSIVLAVREARAVRPDLVAKYGCYLLHNHTNRLGAEVWAMYEQVYTALLMYGKRGSRRGGEESEDMRLAQEYCTLLCAHCRHPRPRARAPCHAPLPTRAWLALSGRTSFRTRFASSDSRA